MDHSNRATVTILNQEPRQRKLTWIESWTPRNVKKRDAGKMKKLGRLFRDMKLRVEFLVGTKVRIRAFRNIPSDTIQTVMHYSVVAYARKKAKIHKLNRYSFLLLSNRQTNHIANLGVSNYYYPG